MFPRPLICSYFVRPCKTHPNHHRLPQSPPCSTALKDGIRQLQCGRVLIESKMRCRGQQQMAGTRQHDTIEDLMLFEKLHPQVDQPVAAERAPGPQSPCCGTAMLPFRLGSDFFFRTSPCLKSMSNQFNTYRPIPKPQLPFKTRVTFCQEAVDLPSQSPPLKPQTNFPRSLGPAWNSEDQLGVGTGWRKRDAGK